MLILSRKESQKIMIGDDIRVCVVHLGSGQVRIGIDAPKDIPVHREEVYLAIKRSLNEDLKNGDNNV